MFSVLLGAWLIFFAVDEITETKDVDGGQVHYTTPLSGKKDSYAYMRERPVDVAPVVEQQFQNISRQQFDYSCGSAALTTVLNYYLGRDFKEQQIMEGLLKYGEYDKIVERRGFSLLDMKRLVTALGHPSGGYRGTFEDLIKLDHPAIVPIHYAGFKHFVVVKKYHDGRVFVADPALGNISFPEERFKQIWDDRVLFIVFPNGFKPQNKLEIAESDMRYIEDKTVNQLAFAQIKDFQWRDEIVADRAGTMHRVFNADPASSAENAIINVHERTYFRRK